MRKFFQNLSDSFLDAVEGGDLHRRRRLVARLKVVVRDLRAIASTTETPFSAAVEEHARIAQLIVDVSEQTIRADEVLRDVLAFGRRPAPSSHAQECERITAELDEFLRQAAPFVRPEDRPN